ncbi:GRIP and coiled-coil domain-containing protein 2 [Cydia pomonella]|uniref:GRIP and coiled-coil domain-containing protein 2 n=1 Tax=Cydia pomonella TaxID=82600 RepID=UPI002ADDD66A|nr:GRIP and coiled-coil domain-containing protein 2 [Cydia pomonella]
MDTETKTHQDVSKKNSFDELSKEELITKCKSLLLIAQKARHSKQDLQSEIDQYKVKQQEYENSKKQYDEKIHTLEELANSLTEQKLNYITDLESAQNKLKNLNQQCTKYEEEIKNHKAELLIKEKKYADSLVKLSDLDSENISFKRQNTRLVEENEQLLNQLSELETRIEEFNNIGLQQTEQLKVLEEKLQSESAFEATFKELNDKIADLESKLKSSENTDEVKNKTVEYENKIKELTELYENEKVYHERSSIKLKSYKDKISKCAACINQLKNSRFILSKTVKEYSENIPKWQNDIIAASVVLDGQLKKLNEENNALKDKIALLEEQLKQQTSLTDCDSTVPTLKEEVHALRNQIIQLQNQKGDLEQNNNELTQHLQTLKDNIQDSDNIKHELEKLGEKYDALLIRNTELEKIETKNVELIDQLQKSNTNNEVMVHLELQIRALESEKSTLVKEKLNARDMSLELEGKNNILTSQIQKMQNDIHNLNLKINELTKENEILYDRAKSEKDGQVSVLKCQVAALQEQHDLLKNEYESVVDINGLLKEEVETLKLSLEQPKDESDNMSELNVSLQADIVKLETKLSAYKQENASLIAEVKESRSKLKEFDSLVAENEDAKLKLSSYKTENAELLNEMKEINQVLKERGESISKLQKAIGEMERLIDTLEKDRDITNQEKEELRKTIGVLERELNNANQKTTEESGISQKLLSDKETAQRSVAEKEAVILALREEIEKLKQQSCSAPDISNEDMSTSTISKAEEYSRMRDLDETFEEKYTKLRIFALKLKKKLNETMMQLQSAEKEKEKLTKLLEETPKTMVASINEVDHGHTDQTQQEQKNQALISELETKVQSLTLSVQSMESSTSELQLLKGELASVNQRLEAEIEAHKATKESLDKARRDVKKKDVLSLEMEDYEKSMKDLTSKMQENKKKIVQMESTIDTQEGTIASMKVQINLLEEQIKAEETQNRLIREELQNAIDESKEKDEVIQAKNNVISKLEQEVEDERRKNEESNFETTSLLSDKEKIIVSLGQDKAELNNKMKRIEFKCAELNDQLNITKIELEDLKTEHASYKVRAQAVLRQNQTVDHSQEERLKEEAAAFKAHIETLTSKLATVQSQWSAAEEEAAAGRRRAAETAGELARAQQRAARLHADLARLTQQLETERTHHKLQVSTLTQCYKTQMADMEARHHKECDELRNQLTIAQETAPLPLPLPDLDNRNYVPVIPKEDSDSELDINVSMIPREEGEGSESAPSPPPSKYKAEGSKGGARSPVPLEQLLEEGVPEDEASDAAALGLTPDQEILDLRRKLLSQQHRVKHVTVLLAESERECARMAQLSELLKGELRRVRGAAGNSAHNAEYMKNVTLKFLTLPPGDERSRLVPVLQKILSLTNDETSKIQAVAKGMDPNPKGWGSYLPWPGGK